MNGTMIGLECSRQGVVEQRQAIVVQVQMMVPWKVIIFYQIEHSIVNEMQLEQKYHDINLGPKPTTWIMNHFVTMMNFIKIQDNPMNIWSTNEER